MFVMPDLVRGTLREGLGLLESLPDGLPRATTNATVAENAAAPRAGGSRRRDEPREGLSVSSLPAECARIIIGHSGLSPPR